MKASTQDPRELAAYTVSDAARILGMPRTTLASWKKGQDYTSQQYGHVRFETPIATRLPRGLSYFDLVEAFVLRSLRTEEGFKLRYIRQALATAQREYGIERLLLHRAFRFDRGSEFFLDQFTHLASLSPGNQLAMKTVLQGYLKRIDYGPDDLATRFDPIVRNMGLDADRLIMVNPLVSFGRPVIKRTGIRTRAIVSRVDAGESWKHIINDFGLTEPEFEQALLLEAA